MKKDKTRKLTVTALLAAICFLMGFTIIGYIPLPIAKITLMCIPVIIGTILEGLGTGLILGLIFGITSLLQALGFNPFGPVVPSALTPIIYMQPLYTCLIIFIPRLIIPVVTYYTYKGLTKLNEHLRVGISALLGSLTNTVFFLLGTYLLISEEFAKVLNIAVNEVGGFIVGIGLLNGLLEAAAAVVICIPLILAIKKAFKNQYSIQKGS